MLFDESDVEKAHGAILKDHPFSLLLGSLGASVGLVRRFYIETAHSTVDQTVVFSLGVRLVNSAGACLKLAGAGYFGPSFHQLRDLAELGQTLEYFIAKPDKVAEWSQLAGWERVDRFSFGKMEKGLRGNFNIVTRWQERFEKYSEFGTHVGSAGAYAITFEDEWQYGPHIDPKKFIQVLGELTIDVFELCSTYCRIVDILHDVPLAQRFADEYALYCSGGRIAKETYESIFTG